MRRMRCWLMGVLAIMALHAAAQNPPVVTIATLNVPRYMGTWYEIAKFPNRFQSQCAASTRAQYLARTDGTVQVLNSCVTAEGRTLDALGLAKPVGPASSPKLQVRFAPAWLSWLPMVWGDYWVIDLDAEYQLAAVSDAKRDYLWVLSRTPQVPRASYDALIERLKAQHFDVHKLELTPQH